MKYDVLIVGAGTAGIFAALELAKHREIKACVVEAGPDIDQRDRKINMLAGWGGAGAFSDGKLTLSPDVGGHLAGILGEHEARKLLMEVDRMWLEYSGPMKAFGADLDAVADIEHRAQLAGMRLVHSEVRHLGTEMCPLILAKMRDALRERVTVKTNLTIRHLLTEDGTVVGAETETGERILADYVIVAPGRIGAGWLSGEADRLGIRKATNPVDIGVRVELPAAILQDITDVVYEPKLVYYSKSFDDQVRSFCVCPGGEVVIERHDGVTSVNGHSYARKKTHNTNFALLVSTSFTEPFHEPITYGRSIASLANLLSDGVIVQRLGDLESGRRSTTARMARSLTNPTLSSAVPGDLSFVLPYRYLTAILEMLHAMDGLAPGVASKHTLLYGVEVKFYSSRLELSDSLETVVHNLFAVGDGAGVTRGLMQASASGVIAAREIVRRTNASA